MNENKIGWIYIFDADGIDTAGLKEALRAYYNYVREFTFNGKRVYTAYGDDEGQILNHRRIVNVENKLLQYLLANQELWSEIDVEDES